MTTGTEGHEHDKVVGHIDKYHKPENKATELLDRLYEIHDYIRNQHAKAARQVTSSIKTGSTIDDVTAKNFYDVMNNSLKKNMLKHHFKVENPSDTIKELLERYHLTHEEFKNILDNYAVGEGKYNVTEDLIENLKNAAIQKATSVALQDFETGFQKLSQGDLNKVADAFYTDMGRPLDHKAFLRRKTDKDKQDKLLSDIRQYHNQKVQEYVGRQPNFRPSKAAAGHAQVYDIKTGQPQHEAHGGQQHYQNKKAA